MTDTNINPNGFHTNAADKSPFKSAKTDRVDPHEGQGMVVIRLNKHTPNSTLLETL